MSDAAWLALCALVTMAISLSNLIVSYRLEKICGDLTSALRRLKEMGAAHTATVENLEKARRAFWAVVSREGGKANRKHKGEHNDED
jgi:hypothetical protein